jgi:hypothetical protein
VGNSPETGQNHSNESGSRNTVASYLCGRAASCEQHRRINFLLAPVHSHSNNTFTVQHTAKLCYTKVHTWPRCATRCKAVQHEHLIRENAKHIRHDYAVGDLVWKKNYLGFSDKLMPTVSGPYAIDQVHTNGTVTIHLRPNQTERINIPCIRPKFPLSSSLRPTQNSLCTRGQGVQHAAKLCNMRQTRNSLSTRGQGVQHAAKLCNTRPTRNSL